MKSKTGTPLKGTEIGFDFGYEGVERIKRITKKLEELWTIYEGMRFCQLTENYLIKCHEHGGGCEFYTTDQELEKKLDKALKEAKLWKKTLPESQWLKKPQQNTSKAKVYKVKKRVGT